MAELIPDGALCCPVRYQALHHPQRPAIRLPRQVLTYRELDGRLNSLQQQLTAAGLRRGDHLVTVAANSLSLLLLAWACLRQGILFCPLNPRQPAEQCRRLMQRLDAKGCWLAPDWPAAEAGEWPCPVLSLNTESALPAEAAELWLHQQQLTNLILTSGSSGEPKAVAHRLAAHLASAEGSALGVPLQPGDGWLLSLPLFHVGGYAIPWRCFRAGACVVLANPECSLSEHLLGGVITHLSLVPTQLYRLLQSPDFRLEQTAVRHLLLGGAPIPASLVAACQAQGVTPQVSYGLSEMATQVCTRYASPDSPSVGLPLPGRELKLVEGEICVRGATLFAGYYREGALEPALDAEGWFHTGDLGAFTADGELLVLGRRDNRFICGGENIQPETIEQALLQHGAVRQALVVPQADDEWGMVPLAFIDWQPSPADIETGQRALTDLEPWLRTRLPSHLIPRRWLPWPAQAAEGLKPSRRHFMTLANPPTAG